MDGGDQWPWPGRPAKPDSNLPHTRAARASRSHGAAARGLILASSPAAPPRASLSPPRRTPARAPPGRLAQWPGGGGLGQLDQPPFPLALCYYWAGVRPGREGDYPRRRGWALNGRLSLLPWRWRSLSALPRLHGISPLSPPLSIASPPLSLSAWRDWSD